MAEESGLRSLLDFSQPRRTAHQFVRETLRRAILSGALPAGSRLVQADLAAELEVSTTPVREALRDLSADGLIRFDPHRGAIVRELDMDELVELYEIRKVLESLAVRKAAERIDDAQVDAALELQDRMDEESDTSRWVELNSQLHNLLYRAAGSPRLLSMVSGIQDASTLYVAHSLTVSPDRIKEGNREHRNLIDAIRAGNADRAAAVLEAHLETTLQTILVNQAEAREQKAARK